MFLPIGDAPNPRTTPWVTYALLALNIAVYALVTLPLSGAPADFSDPLAQDYLRRLAAEVGRPLTPLEAASHVRAYDVFVLRHGFVPAAPTLWSALTCMFLHAGFLHLAGNMLFLWIYGNNVEHRLGRVAYLAAYIGTGLAATAAHFAMDPASGIPTVGASGAISGVLGFYFVFFPRNSVRVAVLLLPFMARVFEIPARIVLGTYLVLDNLVPVLLESSAAGGVAYGAHIGGFLSGLAAGFALDRRERTARPREYRRVPRPTDAITEAGAAVSQALARGDVDTAAQLVFGGGRAVEDAVTTPELLQLAEGLAERGHPEAALALFRRIVQRSPRGESAAAALLGIADLERGALNRKPSSFQHLIDVMRASPQSVWSMEAKTKLREIAQEYRPPLNDKRWR